MSSSSVVLLVDDNAAILESTARYLRNRNLEVISTDSPFGVPSLMTQHAPVVIVLDVMMPALSGETVASMLRSQGQNTSIIYYSAMQEERLYQLSQKTPHSSYVLKSDGNDMLYMAICAAIKDRS